MLRHNMFEKAPGNTVKEIVITSVKEPRLQDVSTGHFIEFKRIWELYERRLEKTRDT